MPQLNPRVERLEVGVGRALLSTAPRAERERAVKILARTLFRDLRSQGLDAHQVLALATELIANVTSEIRDGSASSSPASEPGDA